MENTPQTDFVLLQFIQSQVHQKSYFYWIQDLIATKRQKGMLEYWSTQSWKSVSRHTLTSERKVYRNSNKTHRILQRLELH